MLTAYSAASHAIHGIHNVTVEANYVTAENSGYMHALDVEGFPDLVTDNVVKRNTFYQFTSTCHMLVKNNFYFSNIFNGVTATQNPKHTVQPWGGDMWPWKLNNIYMEARDNWIINNTFVNIEGYGLAIGPNDFVNTNVINNKVANNIATSKRSDDRRTGSGWICAIRLEQ